MGLDTTHGCWHGPYSAFHRWRLALQRAAGWPMHEVMDDGRPFTETTLINWPAITEANIEGEWEAIPEDPLIVLIAHSDCGGIIATDALLPLAERLEGLADVMPDGQGRHPDWTPGMEPRASYDGEREATLRFAAGLRRAAAANEPVEFG